MIEEYFLLVRRVQGIGLSIQEYWDLDTWTTAKLLDMERKIIEEEQKEFNKDKKEYTERYVWYANDNRIGKEACQYV